MAERWTAQQRPVEPTESQDTYGIKVATKYLRWFY